MLLLLIIIAFCLLCLLDYHKRQYWIRRGIKQTPSVPFFGHFFPVVAQTLPGVAVYDKAYHALNRAPIFGIYEFWRPTLVVLDQKLIENILIKDFSHFLDHPRWVFDVRSIVNESLFNMKGNRWRALRYQTIPWFTTARMKSLFPHVLNSIKIPEGEFEIKKYLRLWTSDTIVAFFGSEISDKKSFQEMTARFHDVSHFRYYKLILVEHFSKYSDALGITFTDNWTDQYFRNFLKSILANKNYTLVQRLQKLVEDGKVHLRNKDLYKDSDKEEILTYDVTENTTLNIAAQFIVGGLDTTCNTITWLLYDLALNPEAQSIARQEIRDTLEKHGQWSYEAVQEMKYVANCISESMRLHPTLPLVLRSCTSTYKAPNGFTIDKGTKIVIPAMTIHMNPEIYPQPEMFKPERFSDLEKQTNLNWLPFGEGPRKCPGLRFSLMEMRTLIGRLLENHEIVFTDKTKFPIVADNKRFFSRPLNDIYVELKRID
ncbi:hypothetical protein O3M35_012672 [Rhynocoris fuscipes]|uniref:Cytochrome P450 n=1 Tax=Rhynocoris fuscipes TaxID=488301 RepID=A0AAW1CTW6_9HEMI